jgi:hypothetical protein
MTWLFLPPDSAHWGPKLNVGGDKVETEVPAGCDVQVLPSGRQELLQAQEL